MTENPAKKYYQSDKLISRINWNEIMTMDRCAGGHDNQMQGLLTNITVLGHYNEGDYQGMVATCVELNDTGEVVIYNDSYGSCSGCDAWEDASDDDVKSMCKQLVCDAYIFKTLDDCINFLSNSIDQETSYNWSQEVDSGNTPLAKELLKEINKDLYIKPKPIERTITKPRLSDLDIVMPHDDEPKKIRKKKKGVKYQ